MTTERHQRDAVALLLEAGRDREAAIAGAARDRSRSTRTPLKGDLMNVLSQLDQLGPVLAEVVGAIRPDQLDHPTPCAELTVGGVLQHMVDGGTAFAAAFRGDPSAEPPVGDVLATFGPALSGLASAIASPGALARTIATPFGDLDGETFARYVVLDGLVHGWDVATATGQAYDPPRELVTAADELAHELLDGVRGPSTFAAPTRPAPDATPIERLAAYTGRSADTGGPR